MNWASNRILSHRNPSWILLVYCK
ncbi:unnamed protein product [Spirodela intermedia]|uniref:Uncharacterized protein n=2 Tax=Spirodela intermedia TaxID=51605 RepID=A0A7I8KJM0_SPIIN|nr:unnamed protein product [Spirodela intermedia]CAA6661275.1 unnamed protein product [Spirodela intermedia]CAA7397642.1 unnamed protein product [Spirodela intermedia]